MASRETAHLLVPQPLLGTLGAGPSLSNGRSEQALPHRVTIRKRIRVTTDKTLHLEKAEMHYLLPPFLLWWLFEARVLLVREWLFSEVRVLPVKLVLLECKPVCALLGCFLYLS